MKRTKTHSVIAITGASGFLGSALTEHFSSAGWHVIALVRDASRKSAQGAHPDITYREYDLKKPVPEDLLRGVDYVVHAAYVKYDKAHPDALRTNLRGAERLMAASRAGGVKKNVFISTMSAHDEAVSVYGRQKLAIEALFDQSSDIVLRCGLIIGNGGIVKQMADFMRTKHAVPLIGGGRQPLQIVGLYDLVNIIQVAVTSENHGVFIVATPRIYTYKEFYQSLSKAIHAKVVFIPVPFNLLLGAFRLTAILHLPLGVGEDNLQGLKALRSADTAPGLRQLGVQLDDLDMALSKTII